MSTSQQARKGVSITRVAQSMLFTVLAAAALVLGSLAGPIASANADDGCADVEVVFARGTNEAPGVGATGQAFVDALSADLPGKTVDVYGVNYPASLNFGQAADGVADASNRIQSVAANCPATKIVLGGYSQGAAVAGYTTAGSVPAGFVLPAGISGPMPASVASHVAAVALFGTPDEWVLGLADRSAPPIAIGQPYVAKTIQMCAPGDPICFPGGLNRSAHSSYKDNGMAIQAADFAARQLGGAAPSAPLVQTAGEVTGN
ncbi:cutinase family protein [Mycobacterium sp. DL99]|uniref:cutinase family protein n=1 Tax=Mycobacterium sp. DL99 TaxID=2528957 RepID=UPI001081C6A2|nr:cutinase family protein [Mycobacterium sp. DL99]